MRKLKQVDRLIERALNLIDDLQREDIIALQAKTTRRIGGNPLIDRINAKRGAHAPPTHEELVAYVERLKAND